MKKFISLLLISAVITLCLCSCGKAPSPEGRYVCESNEQVWLEFEGDAVTLHSGTGDDTGTFAVDDGLVITLLGMSTSGEYDEKSDKIVWSGETYVKSAEVSE